MKFAPSKCSYTIFSKGDIKSDIANLNLTIYGRKIEYEEHPKFLGITFDKNMNFEAHIKESKKSFNSRMNILKILSYNGWKYSAKTLIGVYKSLLRSMTDYISFAYNCMSNTSKKFYQTIQNNSIRISHKIQFNKTTNKKVSTTEIHQIANIEMLENRCESLKKEYVETMINTNNPVICESIRSYKAYAGGRVLTHKTPLCNMNIFDYELQTPEPRNRINTILS